MVYDDFNKGEIGNPSYIYCFRDYVSTLDIIDFQLGLLINFNCLEIAFQISFKILGKIWGVTLCHKTSLPKE